MDLNYWEWCLYFYLISFYFSCLLHTCLSSVCCHLMRTVTFYLCIRCMLVQSVSVFSFAVFLWALLSEIKWMMMMMIRDHGVHARQMLAWNKPRSLQPKKTNMSQILPLVTAITTDIQTAESCLIIHPAAHSNHLHYTPLIFCTYYWHAILTKREVCLCCMLLVITGRVTVGWS